MPVNLENSKMFNSDILFKEKKQIANKTNCFVPSDKHKLVHTFIHSQLINKGYKLKIVPLRDLYDSFLISQRVDANEVLKEIEERPKAKIYFDFISILSNTESHLSEYDKKSRNFFKMHNWLINHPRTHHFYVTFIKLKDIIANRLLKAFVDKTVFKNLFVRITDPEWWKKRLFRRIKEYFS